MKNQYKFLVTGGAGFIGSAVVRNILNKTNHMVINVDKLTYAGNLESLKSVENLANYSFHEIDICNKSQIYDLINHFKPTHIMHLAPESHVDTRVVDVHISRLRSKIEDDRANPELILTARGTGYLFQRIVD